ncbi:unnamed protein product [Toxocara canis]|uniref:PilZ domain-containing protein n=1 Tax=Toxocara canis TaxID=6265 RepID=A0A183U5Q1_TOXCA|nr:unnamed protein product [Toxocara canis]
MSACICAPFNCAARTLGSIAVVVVNICAQQRSCYCSNRSDKMVMLYFNRYTRNRKMSRRRIGVTYNVSQAGTGRIIFNENKTKFMGLLVGADGECISLRGSLTAETDDPSTSMMTVTIIDGESGNEFQVIFLLRI